MGTPTNIPYHGNMGKAWESHTFSRSMNVSLPSDSHFMVFFVTSEMHGFSHQFLIPCENAAKPILWERNEIRIHHEPMYSVTTVSWCGGYHYCINSFIKAWIQVLHRPTPACGMSEIRSGENLWQWVIQVGNKTKCFSSINHSAKTINHQPQSMAASFPWNSHTTLFYITWELIWCTSNPNVHIHTSNERWSFIWECFFPVSILK